MERDVIIQVEREGDSGYRYSIILKDSQTIMDNRILQPGETKYLLELNSQFKKVFEDRKNYQVPSTEQDRIGFALFKLWFQDKWNEIKATFTSSDHICIIIASKESEILNLPWELMNNADPHYFSIEPRFSIRRFPGKPGDILQSPPDLRPGPLRILFMACSPRGSDPLFYEREEEYILNEIQGLDVAYDSSDMGTLEELEKRVGEFRPHIVHLSGHGTVAKNGIGYFVFEDEKGNPDPKNADDIRKALSGQGVQCVFVSGCQTGQAPPIEAYNGICQNLVQGGIPFALGWAASVNDIHATDFARKFYRIVAEGGSIDRSVTLARAELWETLKDRHDPSWVLLVLYTASQQKVLYDSKKPAEEAKRNIRPVNPLPGMTEGYAPHFVGRRREQQQILPALRLPTLSTAILTGMGGAGKSALATKIVRKLEDMDQFTPLVLPSSSEIPLTGDLILEKIAIAIGSPDNKPLFDPDYPFSYKIGYILNILNNKKYILLLDNFESNQDQVNKIPDPGVLEFYNQLLYGLAGGSKAIITTRYLPEIGRSLPKTVKEFPLGDLSQASVVKVLRAEEKFEEIYRTQKISDGLLLSDILDELYKAFGGVPRFIEKISKLIAKDPQGFYEELKKIKLPPGLNESELRKKRDEYFTSLVLDRLFQSLSPDSQIALCRCAVYNVAITPDGLAAVAGINEETINEFIGEWKDRAFVFPEIESGFEDLWVLYGMLRPWLTEKLDSSVLKASSLAAGDFLTSLVKNDPVTEIGLSWVSCLLEARSLYLQADRIDLARDVTDRVRGYFIQQGMYDQVRSLSYELLKREDHPDPMVWIGFVDLSQGKYKSAREQFLKALDIQKASGDKLGLSISLHNLACIDLNLGDYDSARKQFNEALKIEQEIGDRSVIAQILHNLASIDLRQGDYDSARKQFNEVLNIRQEIGNRSGIAQTLHNLASIDLYLGDYDSARKQFNEALKIVQEIGYRRGIASTLHQLASIDLYQGDYDSARKQFNEVLNIRQEIGDRSGIAQTLHNLASIDLYQGDYDSARKQFTWSLLICEQLGSPGDMANEFSWLASIAWETGQKAGAITLSITTYGLYQSVKHRQTESELSRLNARASELGLSQDQFDVIVRDATAIYQENGARGLIESIWPSNEEE